MDDPQRVVIANPLVGDETTIAKVLGIPPQHAGMSLEEIAAHDVLWRNAALAKGFDSIVLITPKAFSRLATEGELTHDYILDVTCREFYSTPKVEKQEALEIPMTIGIGVLCCTKPKHPTFKPVDQDEIRPDAMVMFADTMGSTDYDSTDDLHKMYVYPKEKLYGVCAGSIEMCGEIIGVIQKEFREFTGTRTHGSIQALINKAVHGHRSEHFQLDVLLPKFLPVTGPVPPQWQHDKIEHAWQEYDTNANLLVGTFDDDGRALLYYIGQVLGADGDLAPGLVHPCLFPGFRSIGIGSRNANFWLRYRGQVMGNSVKQSAYHAYEAKVTAANAPTVTDSTEVLIAINGREPIYFSETMPAPKESPLSLSEMKSMFLKYGPQDTRKDLGHPKPKAGSKK